MLLIHLSAWGRLVILVIGLFALTAAGPTPTVVDHDIDRVTTASHHQPSAACQSGSHCPVAVEVADLWGIQIALMPENWGRPASISLPGDPLLLFDTPPPRV